jgi:hypothetical protein
MSLVFWVLPHIFRGVFLPEGHPFVYFLSFSYFVIGSFRAAQADLHHTPPSLARWDYRHAGPHLAHLYLFYTV